MKYLPKRLPSLELTELEDELVCYDPDRKFGCHLNDVAASVLRHCDGETLTDDMVQKLSEGGEKGQELLDLTLQELSEKGLIPGDELEPLGLTRRSFLSKSVLAASLPIITIILLPEPAEAQSGAGSCNTVPPTCGSC